MPGASRELAELIRWMTVQQVPRRYPADACELQGRWAGG